MSCSCQHQEVFWIYPCHPVRVGVAPTPFCHGRTHPATAQTAAGRFTAAAKVLNRTDGKRRHSPEQGQGSWGGTEEPRAPGFDPARSCGAAPSRAGGSERFGEAEWEPRGTAKPWWCLKPQTHRGHGQRGWLSRAPLLLSALVIPQKPPQQFGKCLQAAFEWCSPHELSVPQ